MSKLIEQVILDVFGGFIILENRTKKSTTLLISIILIVSSLNFGLYPSSIMGAQGENQIYEGFEGGLPAWDYADPYQWGISTAYKKEGSQSLETKGTGSPGINYEGVITPYSMKDGYIEAWTYAKSSNSLMPSIFLRASDNTCTGTSTICEGYALRLTTNHAVMLRFDGGSVTTIGSSLNLGWISNTWWHIKLEASGTDLKAWVTQSSTFTSSPQLTYDTSSDSNRYSEGKAAISARTNFGSTYRTYFDAININTDPDSLGNGGFESGNLNPWKTDSTYPAGVTASSFYVHSGNYGLRLYKYISGMFYASYIEQSVLIETNYLDEFSFWMKSWYQVEVTFYYLQGGDDVFSYGANYEWQKKTITGDQLTDGVDKTISKIKIRRTGNSGSSTAIDDIKVSMTSIAHYKLDGDAKDSTGENGDGSVSGPTFVPGKINQGGEFGGGTNGGVINLPAISINPGDTKTINLWVKPYSTTVFTNGQTRNGVPYETIPLMRGPSTYWNQVIDWWDVGTLGLQDDPGGYYTFSFLDPYQYLNQWTMITIVFDNTQMKAYANGVLQSTISGLNAKLTLSKLGEGYAGFHLNGIMDDVHFFKTALTQNEIDQLTPNHSVVSQYYFENSAMDASGNGIDGTEKNGVMYRNGVVGMAAEFDGSNDYIDLPDLDLDYSEGFSVMSWVRFDTTGNWQRIIDFGNNNADNNILFARQSTTSNLAFEVYSGSGSGGKVIASNVIQNGKWMHVAAVLDKNGDVVIYVDGNVVATGSTAVPNNVNRMRNYIAKSNWADAYFDGAIDNLQIYTGTLTSSEISSSYSSISLDSDGDGLTDEREYELISKGLAVDPYDADTDDDGLTDGAEMQTDPDKRQTRVLSLGLDNYGTPVSSDVVYDGWWFDAESMYIVSNPTIADWDGDGLNDGEEKARGSSPKFADTDADGMNDAVDEYPSLYDSAAPALKDISGETYVFGTATINVPDTEEVYLYLEKIGSWYYLIFNAYDQREVSKVKVYSDHPSVGVMYESTPHVQDHTLQLQFPVPAITSYTMKIEITDQPGVINPIEKYVTSYEIDITSTFHEFLGIVTNTVQAGIDWFVSGIASVLDINPVQWMTDLGSTAISLAADWVNFQKEIVFSGISLFLNPVLSPITEVIASALSQFKAELFDYQTGQAASILNIVDPIADALTPLLDIVDLVSGPINILLDILTYTTPSGIASLAMEIVGSTLLENAGIGDFISGAQGATAIVNFVFDTLLSHVPTIPDDPSMTLPSLSNLQLFYNEVGLSPSPLTTIGDAMFTYVNGQSSNLGLNGLSVNQIAVPTELSLLILVLVFGAIVVDALIIIIDSKTGKDNGDRFKVHSAIALILSTAGALIAVLATAAYGGGETVDKVASGLYYIISLVFSGAALMFSSVILLTIDDNIDDVGAKSLIASFITWCISAASTVWDLFNLWAIQVELIQLGLGYLLM